MYLYVIPESFGGRHPGGGVRGHLLRQPGVVSQLGGGGALCRVAHEAAAKEVVEQRWQAGGDGWLGVLCKGGSRLNIYLSR